MISLRIDSAWYERGKPVIRGFSLHVAKGETVVVTGPSGAGKSTMLSILAGLHKKYEGAVETGGSVALIPQKDCLLPFHTVLENTLLLARARKLPADAREAGRLLEELGLRDEAGKYPGQLSGGQYSRVALGQALFSRPDVLLMDEPFSALDAGTKAGVVALFCSLCRERGMTTVLVTHDEREAEMVGGRMVRLQNG
jgi:NitT/TauT family transport system ATP-binding protein